MVTSVKLYIRVVPYRVDSAARCQRYHCVKVGKTPRADVQQDVFLSTQPHKITGCDLVAYNVWSTCSQPLGCVLALVSVLETKAGSWDAVPVPSAMILTVSAGTGSSWITKLELMAAEAVRHRHASVIAEGSSTIAVQS